MIWLGLGLGSLGVVDVVCWKTDRIRWRTVVAWVASAGAVVLILLLGGASPRLTLVAAAAITAGNVVWSLAISGPLDSVGASWRPIATIVAVVVGAVLLAPWSPELGGPLASWYHGLKFPVLDGVPLNRFISVVGLGLFLANPGNILVRVVLTAAGSKVSRSEQQIKGGRVLGPMERLLIFGLGLAGQLAAASIIVAAKGLLRFPELQSYRQDLDSMDRPGFAAQRIDSLTEYFLIGSLTSWTLALTCLVFV